MSARVVDLAAYRSAQHSADVVGSLQQTVALLASRARMGRPSAYLLVTYHEGAPSPCVLSHDGFNTATIVAVRDEVQEALTIAALSAGASLHSTPSDEPVDELAARRARPRKTLFFPTTPEPAA